MVNKRPIRSDYLSETLSDFQNGLDLEPDQVGADLGPNFLHSKIIDHDLHCLFDKAEFTTTCSTLNESSIFFIFFFINFCHCCCLLTIRFQN